MGIIALGETLKEQYIKKYFIDVVVIVTFAGRCSCHLVDKTDHYNDVQPASFPYVIGVFCNFSITDLYLKIGRVGDFNHFFV